MHAYTHSLFITTDTFLFGKIVTSRLSNAASFLDVRDYPVMYSLMN